MNFFLVAPSSVVRAATDWGDCVVGDAATFQCLEPIFENIIRAALSLGTVALFIMLLVGGFSFLFSGGDPKKLEQARGTLSGAIIGLVIIIAAYLILRIIGIFTGTEDQLMNFTIPTQ